MYKSLRWALNDLRKLLQLDQAKRQKYLFHPERHFTRKRLLPFARTALLVLSLLKKA